MGTEYGVGTQNPFGLLDDEVPDVAGDEVADKPQVAANAAGILPRVFLFVLHVLFFFCDELFLTVICIVSLHVLLFASIGLLPCLRMLCIVVTMFLVNCLRQPCLLSPRSRWQEGNPRWPRWCCSGCTRPCPRARGPRKAQATRVRSPQWHGPRPRGAEGRAWQA